jgi:cation transport ATPase
MTTPSLYNVNEKDIEENNNSNSKEPSVTDPNTDTRNTKGDTDSSSKESNRLHDKQRQRQEFIKANIITVITALTAIAIAFFFLPLLPIEIALAIWLSSFITDALYTYKNRRLIDHELNYLVRYSKSSYNTLLFGFLLVFSIEVMLLLTISVSIAYMNNSKNNIADAVSIFSILFAVLHISAFIRSYRFVKRSKEEIKK